MRKVIALLAAGLLLTGQAVAQDAAEGEAEGGETDGVVADVQQAHEEVKEGGQQAADEAGLRGSKQTYGPAGCGLGSMIFEPDSGFTQIFAATTNGTSGNQTFGITSGTSNCDDSSGGTESAKAFVQTNRVALAKDIARGRGETINSLSELAGCQSPAPVGRELQKNFKVIFPNAQASDQQVSDSVVQVLQQSPSLACGNLV